MEDKIKNNKELYVQVLKRVNLCTRLEAEGVSSKRLVPRKPLKMDVLRKKKNKRNKGSIQSYYPEEKNTNLNTAEYNKKEREENEDRRLILQMEKMGLVMELGGTFKDT